jgi:hypothetical protein
MTSKKTPRDYVLIMYILFPALFFLWLILLTAFFQADYAKSVTPLLLEELSIILQPTAIYLGISVTDNVDISSLVVEMSKKLELLQAEVLGGKGKIDEH